VFKTGQTDARVRQETDREWPIDETQKSRLQDLAISDDGRWLRIFPVPHRFLSLDQRFRKYQWMDVGL
jgi:hypothetical protein